MSDILSPITSMPPPFNMVALVCLIFAVAGVITSVSKQIRKYACYRQELEFKREMLDRGMTIEEIQEIVRSNTDKSSSC